MSNAFWEIPDEVLFELMDGDLWDRQGEADYDAWIERNEAVRDRLATRVDYTAGPATRICDRCGCKRLSWLNTPNGWRLAYGRGWGNLEGKLHACAENIE